VLSKPFYSHISTINDVTSNGIGANSLSCFRFLLTVTESQGFSKDICRSMVAMLDTDHSGKLGLEEFKSLLNDIAKWKVSFYFNALINQRLMQVFPRPFSNSTTTTAPTSSMLLNCVTLWHRPVII
jgi:hypothetical protein